jgi:ATP-dependent RNA helicase RhlE
MSFEALGLAPELVRVVADEGYTQPTPVQREAIPIVLAGRDLLATAQTGTGKTASFVLPMLQRLARPGQGQPAARPTDRRVRALVLAPTRELALQVEASVRTYSRRRPVPSVAIYGGVGFEPQVRALRARPDIVVATPGRLLDHVGQRTLDLSAVEILVLDEADRMLDMGFIRDIRRVIGLLPARRQNLLFSATFSDEIRSLAEGLLDRPATVDVAPRNSPAELVEQLVIAVDRERKRELLSHLVRTGRIGQALVFTRTKHGANRLAEQLGRDGIRAAAIHGNKSQGQRVRALDDFKAERVDVLVATDIAARGIDIDALPFVVNYEMPMVASDYIHRIGRTGRAGVGGRAVSLVCVDEAGLLREVELLLGRRLITETVAGFEPDRSLRPEPIRLRTAPGGRTARTGGARAAAGGWAVRAAGPGAAALIPARSAAAPLARPLARPAGPRPLAPAPDRARSRPADAPWPPPRVEAPIRLLVALPGERISRTAGTQATDRPAAGPHPRQAATTRPDPRTSAGPRPSAGRSRR